MLPCAASSRPEPPPSLRGRGLQAVFPEPVGLALAESGSGWGGGCEAEEGLTTRATFKACTGADGGEWKATVSWSRPALARQQGPYKEMLFLLSQWDWDRALGFQDRAALVAGGWGCHPPKLSMGHFCRLSIPSQPGELQPLFPIPTHSLVPSADWRKEE